MKSQNSIPFLIVLKITILTLIFSYFSLVTYLTFSFKQFSQQITNDSASEVVYQGVSFQSAHDAMVFQYQELLENLRAPKFFAALPTLVMEILLAVFVGALGSIAGLLKVCVIDKTYSIEVSANTLLGGFSGLIVLLMAASIPYILTPAKPELSLPVIAFLSLLGGIFPKYLFDGIETYSKRCWGKLLGSGKKTENRH